MELWYIPYNGSCRILSINRSTGNYKGPYITSWSLQAPKTPDLSTKTIMGLDYLGFEVTSEKKV